jgi:TolA-binding protein
MKLTRKDIQTVLDSDNNELRKAILERPIADDFDKDVIDGICNSDILSTDFKKLDQKFYKTKFTRNKWFLATLIILTGIACMYFLTPTKNTENKSKIADSKVLNKSEKSIKQTLPVMTKNGDDLQKLRLLEKEKTSLNKKDNASLIRISNNNQVSQNINKLDQELNKMSLLQPKILTKFNTKTVIGKQGIEVYMIDYKTLDYRAYRKKSTKPIDPLSLANATPANSAEKNQIYSENQEVEYNYFNYLQETMKLFSKKMYGMALSNFNHILNNYPDDVNALFYGGLCHFEQNQFKESMVFFDLARKSSFINFREESEWFLLLCYIESNDLNNARLLRNEIINSNGFYAKKAKEIKLN